MEKAHKKLDVWKISMDLVGAVYKLNAKLPREEKYGLTQQMRRCAVSIPSNIAEGSARLGDKESIQFFSMARASLSELDTQTELCRNLGFFNEEDFSKIDKKMKLADILINGLLKYRKNLLVLFFLILPLYLSTPLPVFSAFKENIWSARASAMGGAFAAVSNDVSALAFNPAGLAQMERREGNFGYTQKFMGLPNVTAGNMAAMFGYPVDKIGAFGLGYFSSDFSSIYSERTIMLTYSAPIHKMLGTKTVKVGKRSMEFPKLSVPVYAGLNLKMLSINYNIGDDPRAARDPVFADGQSAGGLAADIGFLVKPVDKLSTALVIKNLVSPNLAIGKDSDGEDASEAAPMEIGLGAAWRFGDFGAFEDFVAALDIFNRMPVNSSAELNWRLGAESWFAYRRYAARLGINNTEIALGGGLARTFGELELQVDYSFALPLAVSDNSGHHRLSVTTRF